MVVGEGFEPSKSLTADLQSAPFGRSGTPPQISWFTSYKTILLVLNQLTFTSLIAWLVAVSGAHHIK